MKLTAGNKKPEAATATGAAVVLMHL